MISRHENYCCKETHGDKCFELLITSVVFSNRFVVLASGILDSHRFKRFMHLTLGRSTFRWSILWINCVRNLFRNLLDHGQKNIWHSQTHFIDEKIRIFRVRHCFFSGISLLGQVNLTQKRDWDRSHIFLSVLWVYKNNLEATEY